MGELLATINADELTGVSLYSLSNLILENMTGGQHQADMIKTAFIQ